MSTGLRQLADKVDSWRKDERLAQRRKDEQLAELLR